MNQQHESPVYHRRTNRSTQSSQEEKHTHNRPLRLGRRPSRCVNISQWLILHVSRKPLINWSKKTQSFCFTFSAQRGVLRKHEVDKSLFKLLETYFIGFGSEICTTIRRDYRNSTYLLFLKKTTSKVSFNTNQQVQNQIRILDLRSICQTFEVGWKQCFPRIDRQSALCDIRPLKGQCPPCPPRQVVAPPFEFTFVFCFLLNLWKLQHSSTFCRKQVRVLAAGCKQRGKYWIYWWRRGFEKRDHGNLFHWSPGWIKW